MKFLRILSCLACSFGGLMLSACAQPPKTGAYAKAQQDHAEVQAAAKFAVETQAKQTKTPLELKKVLEAQSQVVAGVNYSLKLQVVESGKVRTASAVVWHQAWRKEGPYQLTSWQWD